MTDRPLFYLLDGQGNPVPARDEDHHAVEALLKDIDARRVARTEKTIAGRVVLVSTIFLCEDEQYIITASESVDVELFQTCVFIDITTKRFVTTGFEKYYKTRELALQGHEDVCRDVEHVCGKIEKQHVEWKDMGKELKREQELREWIG